MKVNCLIVDDEPLAIEVIESYLLRLEGFKVIKKCSNPVEAFRLLQEIQVDVVFLDILMPKLSGIDLLKSLKYKPKVIITSAHRDYAIEGFDLDVLDYLLKPISFERFLRAIARISPNITLPATSQEISTSGPGFIYLKEDKKMIKILLKDIHYIESIKDYVKVKVNDRLVISYKKIGYLEEKLPEEKFLRVHRSFIISLDKVDSYDHYEVVVGGVRIPIGRNFKNNVIQILNLGNLLHQ